MKDGLMIYYTILRDMGQCYKQLLSPTCQAGEKLYGSGNKKTTPQKEWGGFGSSEIHYDFLGLMY